MSANILIGTAVGAVIGGITNGIAIKMLFRPLHPIKIGGYTLPFTPGVIPKEKERIARKVGQVISKELLNEEVLRSWLLKKEVYEAIEKAVDDLLKAQEENEKTLGEILTDYVGKERKMYYVCEAEEMITDQLYTKIISMELGKMIVDKIKEAFKAGTFGNLFGPMSFLINESLIENIASKMEPVISQFIIEESEGMIRKAVEEESEKLLGNPVKEVAEKVQTYESVIKRGVLRAYDYLIENHLARLLTTINIEKIIEERILSLDMLEIEKLILDIMKKELRAIIWFGVLLGAVMGTIAQFI